MNNLLVLTALTGGIIVCLFVWAWRKSRSTQSKGGRKMGRERKKPGKFIPNALTSSKKKNQSLRRTRRKKERQANNPD